MYCPCARLTRVFTSSWQRKQELPFIVVAEQAVHGAPLSLRQEDDADVVSPAVAYAEGRADDFAVEASRWRQSWGDGNDGTWPQWSRAVCSDPPEWPGWAHYRLSKRMVTRWNSLFDRNFQTKYGHINDEDQKSHGHWQRVMAVLGGLGGILQDDETRRTVRTALWRLDKAGERLRHHAQRPGGAARNKVPQHCQGPHAESRSRAVGTVSAAPALLVSNHTVSQQTLVTTSSLFPSAML